MVTGYFNLMFDLTILTVALVIWMYTPRGKRRVRQFVGFVRRKLVRKEQPAIAPPDPKPGWATYSAFRAQTGEVPEPGEPQSPPDHSWVEMETIGPAWPRMPKKVPKPPKPRRCPICGTEIGPWTGPGPKPEWRIAGYCCKNCSDLMLHSEQTLQQLAAIDKRIDDTSQRMADTLNRLGGLNRRASASSSGVAVWLEAGETVKPYAPHLLGTPNEYAARHSKHGDGVCQRCLQQEKEHGLG